MASNFRTFNNVVPERESSVRERMDLPGLTEVSKTLFLPLYFRAAETLENGMVNDPASVEIINAMGYDNENFHLDREMQLIIALRTLILDRITSQYVSQCHGEGRQAVVLNLGCGLDTRQRRFPEALWYNVDLSTPVGLRNQLLHDSYATNIVGSIFDDRWYATIEQRSRCLILIEGVLMYFDTESVRRLFTALATQFDKSLVAFDALARRYSTVHSHQSIDVERANFKCGVTGSRDVVDFDLGFSPMAEYGYYDEYLNNYDRIVNRYRMIRFDATHKVYLMKQE